jgi:hypothetical protein
MTDGQVSVVGVSTKIILVIDSSGSCLGSMVCNPVASKDPCWSSFRLNGGGGGSSITGGRPKSLRDRRSSGSSTV